ncbi:adenosylmethionine decarboxylase, partial [Neisseria sp. P0001.S010]
MTHMPGNHGLLDLYSCDEAILKDEGRLKTALMAAA